MQIPTSSKSYADMFDDSKDTEWLNPIAMSELKRAVVAKKDSVVLNGDKYTITYGYRRTYPVSKETVDSIRLNRADDSFIPMGYISMKRILDFNFEDKT